MNGDGQRTDSKVQQRILTRHTRISRSAETAHADIELYADRSCIRGSGYGQNASKIDTNATSKVANGTGHAVIPQVLTWLTRRRRQSLFSRDGATLSRVRVLRRGGLSAQLGTCGTPAVFTRGRSGFLRVWRNAVVRSGWTASGVQLVSRWSPSALGRRGLAGARESCGGKRFTLDLD